MRHTPGPWIARMNCDVMAGERRVADCMTGWLREGRANARLIAAAPELLEACKHAISHTSCVDWQIIADAIAKAEGVES